MSQRVLILSTSAGSGHKAAASAIEKVIRQSPDVGEVINRDALEFTNQGFRDLYSTMFLQLVERSPHLLGWWYDESDVPGRTDDLRLLMDRLNMDTLIQGLVAYQPDIIVCTHYMPAGIASYLIEQGVITSKLGIVTTDFDFHSMWLSRLFHHYFVALDETKAHLVTLGMPESHVTVSGIPVDPAFSTPFDREATLQRYQLEPDLPTLLFSAGTVGGGPALSVVHQLLQLKHPAQFVIVCGRNKELKQQVDQLVAGHVDRFRVVGFTNEMPALMRIATLFIGKPGGLTSAEAMAARLPMVIVAPIPGQEERNSDHLLERGTSIKCNDLTVLAYKVDHLLDQPMRLEAMRACCAEMGRPDAASIICQTLLQNETPFYQIDPLQRQMMRQIAKGEVPVVTPQPVSPAKPGMVALFHEQTGVFLGTINIAQFDTLGNFLVSETPDDTNYYIDEDTVQYLQEAGADRDVTDIFARAVHQFGAGDIRWVRGADRHI